MNEQTDIFHTMRLLRTVILFCFVVFVRSQQCFGEPSPAGCALVGGNADACRLTTGCVADEVLGVSFSGHSALFQIS